MKPVRLALAGLSLVLATISLSAVDQYTLPEESLRRDPGAPEGRIEQFQFNQSKVFPETRRDAWIYIPAQYDPAKPAALMVFQDGHAYVSTDGQMRVPIVLDNLIARGEVPVMIGLFINPGHRGDGGPDAAGWGNRNNRSFEYDSLGDAYARFLIDEFIPYTTQRWNLSISDKPSHRAISGMSSGGICAFTAAWERPDYFGKVLSHIGSFVNIRGGHVYPAMIRKTERKPIRVFLQDGSNDLNNLHGDWPLANQQMARSLAFAGYDFPFVFGDGAHNGRHGGTILADSLRWLWRPDASTPKPLTQDNLASDETLSKILPDGGSPGDWVRVSRGHEFTDGITSDPDGNIYFSDLPKGTIWRATPTTAPQPWLTNGPRLSGLQFGADGILYAASQGGPGDARPTIVSIHPETKHIETLATDVRPNDLAVHPSGRIYFTDTAAGQVVMVPTSARRLSRPRPVAGGIEKPNGIALSPDNKTLIVSEYGGRHAWAFLIADDGSLLGGERYMTLVVPTGAPDSGGDGSTTDAEGRVYITSRAGIQMFDRNGRLGGVIAKPTERGIVSCTFGGANHEYLYVCSADEVYRRKTLTNGRLHKSP